VLFCSHSSGYRLVCLEHAKPLGGTVDGDGQGAAPVRPTVLMPGNQALAGHPAARPTSGLWVGAHALELCPVGARTPRPASPWGRGGAATRHEPQRAPPDGGLYRAGRCWGCQRMARELILERAPVGLGTTRVHGTPNASTDAMCSATWNGSCRPTDHGYTSGHGSPKSRQAPRRLSVSLPKHQP
jgi:hypothetical protein